jgi:rare lipoprotein A
MRVRWAAVAAVAILAGCGLRHVAPTSPPVVGGVQVGVASWYGPGFHGNRTANGEIYDQYELTAAHPSLPLGTRAIVTNLSNGRSVEVRINDRGPFVDGRVIDLSYAAARVLDVVRPGTARVRIDVLGTPTRVADARPLFVPPPVNDLPKTHYLVEVASLADSGRADHLRAVLATHFPDVRLDPLNAGSTRYYSVVMGPFGLRNAAVARGEVVNRLGYPAVIREEAP